MREVWSKAGSYEQYVGRWSRIAAAEFLAWLGVPPGGVWSDIGCGSGALVEAIFATSGPRSVRGLDRSWGFLTDTRARLGNEQVSFVNADAAALPWASASCDATVSGLVLNFVPDASAMLREMARVTRPGGCVALYVWDYREGIEMMRHFWDAAVELNPQDLLVDEGERFPLCQPEPLEALFREAGLTSVSVRDITFPTVFRDFDDYWLPFLSNQGAAPVYLASLDSQTRDRIREELRSRLPTSADGSIPLSARAWAARGSV